MTVNEQDRKIQELRDLLKSLDIDNRGTEDPGVSYGEATHHRATR